MYLFEYSYKKPLEVKKNSDYKWLKLELHRLKTLPESRLHIDNREVWDDRQSGGQKDLQSYKKFLTQN